MKVFNYTADGILKTSGTGGGGSSAGVNPTYLTINDETADLPNSERVGAISVPLLATQITAYGTNNWHVLTGGNAVQVGSYSDTNHPLLQLLRADGSTASPADVDDTDILGEIAFLGRTGGSFETAASIRVKVSGTPGTNDLPGEMITAITPDGSDTYTDTVFVKPGQMGIGGTPGTGKAVAVTSTTGGLEAPSMTRTQADAINTSSPPNGILVYDTTNSKILGRQGGAWAELGSGSSIAVEENNVSVVAAASTVNFVDLDVVSPGGNQADIYVHIPSITDGRITFTNGTPITTSDVTGATTCYLNRLVGEFFSLYDGANLQKCSIPTGGSAPSLSLASYGAHRLVDVFAYPNSSVPALEGLAWTAPPNGTITGATNATPIVITSASHGLTTGQIVTISGVGGNTAANGTFHVTNTGANTFSLQNLQETNVAGSGAYTSGGIWTQADYTSYARATALDWFKGYQIKNGDATRRYLGTIKIGATAGQSEDSVTSRLLWNLYNQVQRPMYLNAGNNHTYNSSAARSWNKDRALRLQSVSGLASPLWGAIAGTILAGAAGSNAYVAIDLDGTSAIDLEYGFALNSNTNYVIASSAGIKTVSEGFHYLQAIESGDGSAASFTQVQLRGYITA